MKRNKWCKWWVPVAAMLCPLVFAVFFIESESFVTYYLLFFMMLGAPVIVGWGFDLLGLFPSVDPEEESQSSFIYGIVIYFAGIWGASLVEKVFYKKPDCYVISYAVSIMICWIYWSHQKKEWLERKLELERKLKEKNSNGHNT